MEVDMRFDRDPRSRDDFSPEFFPLVDGNLVPEDAPADLDPRWMAKLRFAAVYYHLNMARMELETARRENLDEVASLKYIERILVVRDSLESECASIGLNAEPVVVKGKVADLRFVDPPIAARSVRHSVLASVPLPPGVTPDEP